MDLDDMGKREKVNVLRLNWFYCKMKKNGSMKKGKLFMYFGGNRKQDKNKRERPMAREVSKERWNGYVIFRYQYRKEGKDGTIREKRNGRNAKITSTSN